MGEDQDIVGGALEIIEEGQQRESLLDSCQDVEANDEGQG